MREHEILVPRLYSFVLHDDVEFSKGGTNGGTNGHRVEGFPEITGVRLGAFAVDEGFQLGEIERLVVDAADEIARSPFTCKNIAINKLKNLPIHPRTFLKYHIDSCT